MAECPRGEDQHFDGVCNLCGQECICQHRVVAKEIVWRMHEYGSGEDGFLGGLKMFVLSWRAGRQGDPPLERPYQLTTILPIRKSVTETWLFKERETAKDSAWRAASGWLQFHAAEVK